MAQIRGLTEAELAVQLRVLKVVQEFPGLNYEMDAIPPGRTRAEGRPSALVLPGGDRWVAVQYVPRLDVDVVNKVVEANFLADLVLVVGHDGTAIAASVAPTRAYPITIPTPLEAHEDWSLERVVREALSRLLSA